MWRSTPMIFIHKESREPHEFPADHRSESRLSIPQRGALQQSSSPLPQPSSIFNWTAEVCREIFSERRVSNTPSVSQLGCTAKCSGLFTFEGASGLPRHLCTGYS